MKKTAQKTAKKPVKKTAKKSLAKAAPKKPTQVKKSTSPARFKFKLNYIIIPLITFFTAYTGSLITESGMEWYSMINKPEWTPPGYVIGFVWTTIFVLTALSALRLWNKKYTKKERYNHILWIMFLFIVNAILNVLWSFIFFDLHNLFYAVVDAGLLGFSVLMLMITIWPVSKLASALLLPYLGWVSFATYLTYIVYTLN